MSADSLSVVFEGQAVVNFGGTFGRPTQKKGLILEPLGCRMSLAHPSGTLEEEETNFECLPKLARTKRSLHLHLESDHGPVRDALSAAGAKKARPAQLLLLLVAPTRVGDDVNAVKELKDDKRGRQISPSRLRKDLKKVMQFDGSFTN